MVITADSINDFGDLSGFRVLNGGAKEVVQNYS